MSKPHPISTPFESPFHHASHSHPSKEIPDDKKEEDRKKGKRRDDDDTEKRRGRDG